MHDLRTGREKEKECRGFVGASLLASEELAEGFFDRLYPDEADGVAFGAQPVEVGVGEDECSEADALCLDDALLDARDGAYFS